MKRQAILIRFLKKGYRDIEGMDRNHAIIGIAHQFSAVRNVGYNLYATGWLYYLTGSTRRIIRKQ